MYRTLSSVNEGAGKHAKTYPLPACCARNPTQRHWGLCPLWPFCLLEQQDAPKRTFLPQNAGESNLHNLWQFWVFQSSQLVLFLRMLSGNYKILSFCNSNILKYVLTVTRRRWKIKRVSAEITATQKKKCWFHSPLYQISVAGIWLFLWHDARLMADNPFQEVVRSSMKSTRGQLHLGHLCFWKAPEFSNWGEINFPHIFW